MKHDDDELRALIEAEPDPTDDRDPRWAALAEGRLSSEARRNLVDEAEDDELTARLWDALAPVPDADEAAFAAAQASFHQTTPRAASRGGWRRWAAVLAVAAAIVLVVIAAPRDGAPIPDYAASWRVGSDVRSTPSEAPVQVPGFAAGASLELRLVPETAPGAMVARVAIDDWPNVIPHEVTDRGLVVVRGRLGEGAWNLPPGRHVVVVGLRRPPGPLESDARENWQISLHEFDVR